MRTLSLTLGVTEEDKRGRIGKAQTAFRYYTICGNFTKQVNLRTKVKIFNLDVKSALFYGSESWRWTKNTQHENTKVCKQVSV